MDIPSNRMPGSGTVRGVIAAFQRCWVPLFEYEVIFKVLVFLVAAPLSTWLLSLLVDASGEKSITNMAIIPFLLSSPGAVTVLTAGALLLVSQMAEEAGLLIVAARSRAGKQITALRAMVFVIRQLPLLVGAALAEMLIVLAWTAPFLAAGGLIYFILQASHDINYYLKEWPPVFIGVVVGMSLLGAGLVAVLFRYFVRWTFAMPVCLFERLTFFQALKRSAQLVRGSFWRIFGILAAWSVGTTLVAGVIMAVLGAPAGLLAAGNSANLVLMAAVVAGTAAAVGLVSLAILPLINIVILHLYFDAYRRKDWPVPEAARCTQAPDVDAWRLRRLSRAAFVSLAAAVFIAAAAGIGAYLGYAVRQPDRTHVIAHRGDSIHAPENTLGALRKAIALKAETAEIDVQETKDGVIMVLHDNDLLRVAGVPKGLWQLTYAEARELDVGSWFSPEFKDEKLPTLEEVIDLARGKIRMIIELKYNGHDQKLAERTVAVIRRKGFEDQCVISSLNYDGLQEVKAQDAGLKTLYILFTRIGNVASLKADGFALQAAQVTPGFIGNVQAKDKPAYVWTVDDPAELEKFIEMDTDYIYTNDPATLMAILQRRAAMAPAEKMRMKFKRLLDSMAE